MGFCGIRWCVWVTSYRSSRRTRSFECRPLLHWWRAKGHHERLCYVWLGSPPQWTIWQEENTTLKQKYLILLDCFHVMERKISHPFCMFSNQKRSAFLMRSNWSRMMVENTGPGPSCVSSRPPTNSSSLEISFSYNSASFLKNWDSKKQILNNCLADVHSGYLLLRDSIAAPVCYSV